MENLYPLKFKPVYQEKIWGGNRLRTYFQREIPSDSIGESWEVSTHRNGPSIVTNGPLAGRKFAKLIEEQPENMLGYQAEDFPLLFKFLDASRKLSVQVHPSDDYAQEVENEPGKTEMWYVLAAEPGAKLVYGLKKGTTQEKLARAIKENRLEEHLNEVEVEAGDIFFMPAGMVHAIEEGILLTEIQQNSDTTYRVYDWGRMGKNGKPRELHVQKALEVIDFSTPPAKNGSKPLTVAKDGYTCSYLAACQYFAVEKIKVRENITLPENNKFRVLNALKGQAIIKYNDNTIKFTRGESVFIPASHNRIEVEGRVEFLQTYTPPDKIELIQKLKNEGFTAEEIKNLAGITHWD